MGDYTWQDIQNAESETPREPRALVYTSMDTEGWDEDDWESAGLAMENNMVERAAWHEREADSLGELDPRDVDYDLTEAIKVHLYEAWTLRRRAERR